MVPVQHRARIARVVASVSMVCTAAFVSSCTASASGPSPGQASYSAVVTRAVDGDTIVVQYTNGRTDKVRLIGVDTPETHKPNTPVQCFGLKAAAFILSPSAFITSLVFPFKKSAAILISFA